MTPERLEQYDVFGLPVGDISYDASFNCRGEFTVQSVKDLADSIVQFGLHFPVTVQPWDRDGFKYRLLAGHRRFKAVTVYLKWALIPANIRPDLDERQARLLNFTENLERKDLNILEEARAIRRLYPEGITLRQAALELKRPTRWVHVRLRLLQQPEYIQQQAAAGILSAVNVEALAGVEDPDKKIAAAREIVAARQRGKGHKLPGLPRACKRAFQAVRSKDEINRMVERMFEAGISGLAPRVGAWCAGYLTDDELLADIESVSCSSESLRISDRETNDAEAANP